MVGVASSVQAEVSQTSRWEAGQTGALQQSGHVVLKAWTSSSASAKEMNR